MKSGLFRFWNILILAGLVACSSIAPSPTATLTATLTPVPTATQTLTPTITATATPTLPEILRPLQEKLGNQFWIIPNESGYFDIKDADGKVIERVKVFEDGSTSLDIAELAQSLVQPLEAITVGPDNQLVWSLWSYENGEWAIHTQTAAEMVAGAESPYRLYIVEESPNEQAMIDAIFAARDFAMTTTEGYRPESEFEGMTVNGIENFDNTPDQKWRIVNWSRAFPGNGNDAVYKFDPEPFPIEFRDNSSFSYARPIQPVVKGSGYFRVQVVSPDNQVMDLIHVPIVAKNTDSSLILLSALVRAEDFLIIEPFLNPQERGHIYTHLLRKPVEYNIDDYRNPIIADDRLMTFSSGVNTAFFASVPVPGLDQSQQFRMDKLPTEASRAFFTLFYYYKGTKD